MDDLRPDIANMEDYQASCLKIAAHRLAGFVSMAEVAEAEAELNAYPNLGDLSEPGEVFLLDGDTLSSSDLDRARQAVLDGRVFWEHTAAGEATRLKLGTKFLIFPPEDLAPLSRIARLMSEELKRPVSIDEIRSRLKVTPDRLMRLSLGARHLLQQVYDLNRIAEEAGRDPSEVLSRQHILVILNEKTADVIMDIFLEHNFFGFSPNHVLIMIQPAFPGIDLQDGRFFYEPTSPHRMHNHGQLVMQETMDRQIFHMDSAGRHTYLNADEFAAVLQGKTCKISYNIEDLNYLSGSIDWPALAQALKLGAEGYDMVMEIVANDPDSPIKGGLAAHDNILKRDVMIESFQLKGLAPSEIKFLNKNFNHYTNPIRSWEALREKRLSMPISVKQNFLYFQPVQGDINFLVKTAFVQRRELKPIRAWKSPVNTPVAINAMWDQENQLGFRDLAQKILNGA